MIHFTEIDKGLKHTIPKLQVIQSRIFELLKKQQLHAVLSALQRQQMNLTLEV